MPQPHQRGGSIALPVFGIVFGILGILTIGAIFVPLAILCTVCGLLSGLTNLRADVLGLCILSAIVGVIGWVVSPSMWLMTAGIIAAASH
jgi:hypothetical protein